MESTQNLVFEVTKNSSLAGIATGILHHSILQYPKQAKLFTILKAFFFVDALFLVLKVGSLTEFSISTLGEVVLDLTLFNTLYVSIALLNLLILDYNCISSQNHLQCLLQTYRYPSQVSLGSK